MSQEERWADVDAYINEHLVKPSSALKAALKDSVKAGLPPINVSPSQGKLLHILARLQGARRILEIGTLGGYSTIWLASALPEDGKLISLELDGSRAEIARKNIARAGLSNKVEIRLGKAIEILPKLEKEGAGPFDLSFLDADKPSNPEYFRWALKLSRVGSLIVVDNVIRKGAVADSDSTDADVKGVRRMNDAISAEPRVIATAIQTVGAKGYDGFAVVLVVSD